MALTETLDLFAAGGSNHLGAHWFIGQLAPARQKQRFRGPAQTGQNPAPHPYQFGALFHQSGASLIHSA